MYLGQMEVQIQTRIRIQLGMSCDAAGGTGRNRPVDSLFGPRPNYAVLSSALGLLLGAASSAVQAAATIQAASPALIDVSRAIASAVDGDTVIVPPGKASWTSGLVITKGVTLMGQTTTDPINKTANDQTIILDNVVRGAGGTPIISVQSVLGKSYRLSGITFSPGSVTTSNYNGAIKLLGNSQTVRVDHCHFNNLAHQAVAIRVMDSVYGVIDHNVIDFNAGGGGGYSIVPSNGGDGNGDAAWAAPAAYGSSQFIFIEDNCFNNLNYANREYAGSTDDDHGARWVYRYNHCYDVEVQTHGTECCRYRGGRAREVYNNDFHFSVNRAGTIGIRCGGLITHDNTWYGAQPNHGAIIQAYRMFFKFPNSPWAGASGDNPWDSNDPHGLYESGTATGGNTTHLIDTTKNWTANQWAGYTAKRLSDNGISLIRSNTSNTLTVLYYADSGGGPHWTAGDQYQIHKVLIALDQPGRGQDDLIAGNRPINRVTRTATWPHQALEPCYSWNDRYAPTNAPVNIHAGPGAPILIEGRDFYNNTPMRGYTPYTYPHPLTTSWPSPSTAPSATPSSPYNLPKKWRKQAKELKGKKGKTAKENLAKRTAQPDQ